jgi:RNA polymerase sigma-70 factor (ECF subfamily)
MPELQEEDRRLARRLLSGDEQAFEQFFSVYSARLYRFACARLHHDGDAAEEVVQRTLSKALAKLATYRGEAALFTWLCTFCRHEISAYYSRRARWAPETPLLEDSPDVRAALESLGSAGVGAPDEQYRRREVARHVQVTLDALPQPYGDALEWKYIQGWSVNEIARALGVGPKAAESLLTRARVALRVAFSPLQPDVEAWER